MSSLLTQIVRRQTLTMVQRRSESVLLQPGPPLNKVTNGEKMVVLGLFLTIPMIYPVYIMSNLQSYNGSNRTASKTKKPKANKK